MRIIVFEKNIFGKTPARVYLPPLYKRGINTPFVFDRHPSARGEFTYPFPTSYLPIY
jgi:hypothetical protein